MAAFTGTRPAARNHQLPKSHFEALCAGRGDAEAIRELWSTQRSRRLLLIDAVVKAANEVPGALGPLPPAAEAWDVLTAAEQAEPAEFTTILLHPQVGNWAAYVLRRHRGGADSEAPLWIDFGVLHALALSAASRVGLAWRTRVPARNGRIMLPRLGMAAFPVPADEPWSWAGAETDDDGRIRLALAGHELAVSAREPAQSPQPLPPSPSPSRANRTHAASWWPLRGLHVSDRPGPDPGPELFVSLDDIDPNRDLADPVPPDRLDGKEFAAWSKLLAKAWDLLCRDHREAAEAMSAGVVSLVPLPPGDGTETRSASTGEAFGSVLISPPFDEVTLAVSLIHEFQHIKLGGLMHLRPLTADDGDRQCYYAPWRDDPRPIAGLLQGAYAFAGIVGFWGQHRERLAGTERRLADFEFGYSRIQVNDALRTLSDSDGLTHWGEQVVRSLTEQVQTWLAEPLPPRTAQAAELAAAWHRAGWRIRHLQPASEDVNALAAAWVDNAPVVVAEAETETETETETEREAAQLAAREATVIPHPQLRFAQSMSVLIRRQLSTPERVSSEWLSEVHLTEADAALVRGDLPTARISYTARIKTDPDDFDAWVGLGLTATGCTALLDVPDLVRAVYLRLTSAGHAPDPALLAERIGRAIAAEPAGVLKRVTSCPG